MTHPSVESLALYAGGDLNVWNGWRIGRHVGYCAACRAEVEAFRGVRGEVHESAGELPANLNWDRLADEMKANIRLGVAAGECISPVVARPERLSWRAAVALASLTLIVLTGWWLNIPQADWRQMQAAKQARPSPGSAPAPQGTAAAGSGLLLEAAPESGIFLEANSAGIELKENGRALTLVNRYSRPVTLSVSAQGSMRARYVDPDTGQVTIHNVYAE